MTTLLMFMLLLLFQQQGSAKRKLPGIKEYEVVYPKKLHVLHKRDVAGNQNPNGKVKYDDTMQYEIKANGKKIILHLQKNKGLFAKNYTETYYSHDGQEVTTSPQIKDHCYYEGYVQNDSDSAASISACDGLRGYFKTRGQRYLIQPLKLNDSEEHAVFNYENLEDDGTPKTCGVTNTTWESEEPIKKSSRMSNYEEKQKYLKARKYIEFYVVADNAMYKKYKYSVPSVKARVFEIVNYVNMVYKMINTHVALIGIEIWSDKDRIVVNSSAGVTLDRFSSWRVSDLLERKRHDNSQLLTGIHFQKGTVGLAFVGTMCSNHHSAGVIEDHNSNPIAVGATVAHEMGHNLGMNHDTRQCKCNSESCIMTATLSYKIPREFSSCSLQEYEQYILSKMPPCLLNVPEQQNIVAPPVCGNNFIEEGEDCDCGTPEECTNVCCEAATCKLKPNAACGYGECCENCQVKKGGSICRAAKDECDLSETCTGQSQQCPKDRFRVNGHPCKNGQGYCYMGKCPTQADQCIKIWGSGGKVAEKSCYNTNRDGVYYGYCKKENNKFLPCADKDKMCGKLFCTGGADMPVVGAYVSFDSCKSSVPHFEKEDISLVDNGTKCGNGMVCSNGVCLDVERAYRSTNCSAKCRGHAVCNHELECQCEEGWAPPNCEDSTTVKSIAIISGVLAALTVIAILVALFIRYQKSEKKYQSSQEPAISGATNQAYGGQEPRRKEHPAPNVPNQKFNDTRVLLPVPPAQENKPNFHRPIIKPSIPPPPVPTSKPAFFPATGDFATGGKSAPSPVNKGKPPPPRQALKPPTTPRV
ncbi:zinc metalloproteinase-disintegrin-like NaMP isoform X1 [Alligator mississippiensis]|uniref:zinc metalloproteinase-disintegrin-like NaMP isoform X1 n=1 Tax=Alligator mississippiensis TaxID=8496 RepID=UPI002877CE0E|nr:zinc metalloproteinase-disintegrin-like NaMP isoform X1 [Alligator mississippiensis]